MSKHTSGPWMMDVGHIPDEEGIDCWFIWGPEGAGMGRVAQIYAEAGSNTLEELEANARLAAALPELFEFAKWATEPDGTFSKDQMAFAENVIEEVIRRASEVVALVEGEPTTEQIQFILIQQLDQIDAPNYDFVRCWTCNPIDRDHFNHPQAIIDVVEWAEEHMSEDEIQHALWYRRGDSRGELG